jgi:hypothetical protein
VTEDQRQRLARLTPGDQWFKPGRVRGRRGIAQQCRRRDAVRMRQQQPCLQQGIVDTRPPQPLSGETDRGSNRVAQAA